MPEIDQREVIADGIDEYWNNTDCLVDVSRSKTTSGCPVLELTYGDGEKFNITITRSRKS